MDNSTIESSPWGKYVWKETNPGSGIWQRNLTPRELFFNPAVLNMSIWTFITIVHIPNERESDFVTFLRRAWGMLVHQQPNLAATHDFEQGICSYTTFDASSHSKHVEETFFVVPHGLEAHTFSATPGNRCEKPALYVNVEKREIMLRALHSYVDGIGSILLLRDLVKYLNATSSQKEASLILSGTEAQNLAPVYEIAANLPAMTAGDKAKANELVNEFGNSQPNISLPIAPHPHDQGRNQPTHAVSKLTFSLPTSSSIITASKSKSITVTHAIHAALILATMKLSTKHGLLDPNEKHFYASPQSISWRPKLLPENQKFHATLYNASFLLIIPDPGMKTFAQLAAELKTQYLHNATDEGLERAQEGMWIFGDGESAGPPPTILSSLGVVDGVLDTRKDGREVEIGEFGFGLDVKGPVLVVYAWSWRGRVRLCCSWDRGLLEEGFVDGLLRGVGEELRKGLGVGIDLEVEVRGR